MHRGRALRLDRDHAPVGRRRRRPGNEAAAAGRHEDRLDLGRVLEQLERERPLAGDHERVVERDARASVRSRRMCSSSRGERLDGIGRLEVDLGAVAPCRRDLRRRSRSRT